MKRFSVELQTVVTVTVTVEADEHDQAIETALDEGTMQAYAGNGGLDKIIGVESSNASIMIGEHVEVCEVDEV